MAEFEGQLTDVSPAFSTAKPIYGRGKSQLIRSEGQAALDVQEGLALTGLKGAHDPEVTADTVANDTLNLRQIETAREQGLISADEAQIRVSTKLKESINQSPGLETELRSAAGNFFAGAGGSTLTATTAEKNAANFALFQRKEDYKADIADEQRIRQDQFDTFKVPAKLGNYSVQEFLKLPAAERTKLEQTAFIIAQSQAATEQATALATSQGATDDNKIDALEVTAQSTLSGLSAALGAEYRKIQTPIGSIGERLKNETLFSIQQSLAQDKLYKQQLEALHTNQLANMESSIADIVNVQASRLGVADPTKLNLLREQLTTQYVAPLRALSEGKTSTELLEKIQTSVTDLELASRPYAWSVNLVSLKHFKDTGVQSAYWAEHLINPLVAARKFPNFDALLKRQSKLVLSPTFQGDLRKNLIANPNTSKTALQAAGEAGQVVITQEYEVLEKSLRNLPDKPTPESVTHLAENLPWVTTGINDTVHKGNIEKLDRIYVAQAEKIAKALDNAEGAEKKNITDTAHKYLRENRINTVTERLTTGSGSFSEEGFISTLGLANNIYSNLDSATLVWDTERDTLTTKYTMGATNRATGQDIAGREQELFASAATVIEEEAGLNELSNYYKSHYDIQLAGGRTTLNRQDWIQNEINVLTAKSSLFFNKEAGNEESTSTPTTDGIIDRTDSKKVSEEAPQISEAVVSHLKLREGERLESYKDSLGKLTGGVGHLLSAAEKAKYPEGTKIPQEVVDKWLVEDSAKAQTAANSQGAEIGATPELIDALTSVNFQLGTNWKTDHKRTWKLMKEGKFEEAAAEAANSLWNEQTPTRVFDFQAALIGEAIRRA